MKRLFALLPAVALTMSVFAQAPEKFSYQAVIRNSSDALVTNTQVGMQISILQGSASGTAVYVETQTPTTNANGLISVEIGNGTVVSGDFTVIDWVNGPYFIKTETDPNGSTGGISYTIAGTSQLLSVPYALYSKTAESITGGITKAYVDALLARIKALEESDLLKNGFTDTRDGSHYNVVKIGSQIWMAENLKATKYADGTAIPLVNSTATWEALTEPSKAYCWYNDDIANKDIYGALYTWAAAMNGAASVTANPSGIQGVCPTGWHLPSDAEWTQMADYLADNGYNYDGTTGGGHAKIAKSLASTSGWNSTSFTGAVGNTDYPTYRNKSGFTALPGGYRYYDGGFGDVGNYGAWWSATEDDATDAWYRYVHCSFSSVAYLSFNKEVGNSVRCLRD